MFTPGSLTGKKIDQFHLEEFIGQGAMGMVYKATDTILNRTVALKLISKKSDITTPAMAEARKRLIQEAQAAGRLAHPNIVTIHSYGETEDFQYICMEYITGKTLAEILNEQKVLAVEEAGTYFDQILQAIEAASQEQIVHRDIKPTNIMIMADKRLKVMDFGIAKIPSLSITTTGTVLGTPYYMSPEQISGQKVDIRSDIFSVGAVFYQVLTGERPFEGESTVTLAYKIVQVEPIPPKVLNVHIPPAIENIVKKALAKDPFQRYQTPAEMLADLRAALRPSAPPKPAVSDTTIKSKSAAFEQTLQLSPKEAGPAREEPQPSPLPAPPPRPAKPEPAAPVQAAEAKPAPKPAPPSAPAPRPGGSTMKTLAISGGLLLVMVVVIVLVVRVVKKPSAVPPLPPVTEQAPKSTTPGGTAREIAPPAKGQAEQLVAQAKADLTANPANAQKMLEQAVTLDPKNFEAQYQLARLFTARKNYPAAIQHYQEALTLNNQVPEIPFNLGFIYLNQGDYDLAIRYYEACRALSPPYQDEVLTNLGIAYLKKNNPVQAQLFFKQAIGLNPNNSLARNYLQAQPASGSAPAAAPVPDNPSQAAALIAQAKGQLQTNPARAQGLLEQAIKLDPANYEAPYQLGRLLTFQKNFPQAVQHYQSALKLNPRIPEVHFNLGYILMTQGQYDQAIKYFDSCRALSPPFQDEVLTNLGISYLKKNNPAQAQSYFREALKINPKNSLARSYLQNLGG